MNQLVRWAAEAFGVLIVMWGFLGIIGGINAPPYFQIPSILMGFSNVLAGLIASPTAYSFISERTGIHLSTGLRILVFLLLTIGVLLGVIVFAPLPSFG